MWPNKGQYNKYSTYIVKIWSNKFPTSFERNVILYKILSVFVSILIRARLIYMHSIFHVVDLYDIIVFL